MTTYFLDHTISRAEMFFVVCAVTAFTHEHYGLMVTFIVLALIVAVKSNRFVRLDQEASEAAVDEIVGRYRALLKYTGWDDRAVVRQMKIDKTQEAQDARRHQRN